MPELKVGDQFPTNVTSITEGNPGQKVDLAKELKGKVIVFGVPGAFTPGCSNTHLPSFLKDYEKIKGKGVNQIICFSVNDAFVMHAWEENTKATGKIRFFADASGELAKATGLDFEAAPLGGTRFKRFSAVLQDGKVEQINVEPDSTGLTCSLAPHLKL